MKLVFTADLHIGSAFGGENSSIRNAELVSVFEDIVKYANNICAPVLIGGDLFDTPYPSAELSYAVRAVIEKHPHTRFFAVCGNHDPYNITSFYKNAPDNMFVFPTEITEVNLGDVTLAGVSLKSFDTTLDIWQGYTCHSKCITLSHGDLFGNILADTGANLSLLGHIHKTSAHLLSNGKYALYCGTPAGRGFDECGEKGFYVIDTSDFSYTFVKTDTKIYKEYSVDVTGAVNTADILDKLCIKICDNEIARAVLIGKTDPSVEIDTGALLPHTPFSEIKDKTEPDIDFTSATNDNTLEGEFVRILLEDKQSDPDIIRDALYEGVRALRRQK